MEAKLAEIDAELQETRVSLHRLQARKRKLDKKQSSCSLVTQSLRIVLLFLFVFNAGDPKAACGYLEGIGRVSGSLLDKESPDNFLTVVQDLYLSLIHI